MVRKKKVKRVDEGVGGELGVLREEGKGEP